MKFFDNPIMQSYNVAVANAASGAVADRIQGPPGSRGMIVSLSAHITTDVTVAPDVVQIGNSGTADAYGTFTVAVAAADAVDTADRTELAALDWLPADTAIEISNTGDPSAGAYDVDICVAWERKFPRP